MVKPPQADLAPAWERIRGEPAQPARLETSKLDDAVS